MGREVKRVALDFEHPLDEIWPGFINPHYAAKRCSHCAETGYSREGRTYRDLWYGYAPFKPEDRESTPVSASHPVVRARAVCNVGYAPRFYKVDAVGELAAIEREAVRLAGLFNGQWAHHLNQDDVDALVKSNRLMEFTHEWVPGSGWIKKDPPAVVTAKTINEKYLTGMGHDSINSYVVIKARCEREGVPLNCDVCNGHGEVWPSEEARAKYDGWQQVEPPTGPGYQMWETVSEGSPISPVFATPEELADYLVAHPREVDRGTTRQEWLNFIGGPGWSPSFVGTDTGVTTGVQALARAKTT